MSGSEFLRWAACAVVVVAAHGFIALAIASRPDDFDLEAGAPVVMIELAPISVAPPAPPSDLAPGPQQPETESQERMAEVSPPEQRQSEEKRETPDMPAPEPTVALPPPVPEPAKQPEEAKAEPEPKEAAPVPTAPPSVTVPAERPAAPDAGRVVQPTSRAVVSWQRQLMAHLEHYKRYPSRAHGERGTASVAFTIDREGRVSDVRIVRSSGSSVLDDETLAMIRRAQPLPVPPGGTSDQQLSFIVPIRYAASR
jgi:periplasmic protein TonB